MVLLGRVFTSPIVGEDWFGDKASMVAGAIAPWDDGVPTAAQRDTVPYRVWNSGRDK